ncbi:MAG TPA: hypothetical protein VE907_03135 [Gammaproteobacteria bacterium]|nr:hypothetical protein [Gammaproteobacteria bacterium]
MRHKSAVPWLVGAVCLGPFALALLVFYGPWILPPLPGSRVLLEPPVVTPVGWLADSAGGPYRWSLIYAKMTPCEPQCVRDLDRLSQVHLALGRDIDRLQRVYLHTGEAPPRRDNNRPDGPPLLTRRLDEAPGASVARALDAEDLAEGRVYVADPRGNLVASYPPEVEQKELLRDLKRLLAGSN